MTEFKYIGKNPQNKTEKGKIKARSKTDAFDSLKEQGIYSYRIEEVIERTHSLPKLKDKELAEFSRQIGSMLNAGVSITKAVTILKEHSNSDRLEVIYEKLLQMISEGNTLSYAMEECKRTFPLLMINMYRAGEISGGLDQSALKMADYYDKENKLNTKIKGAMTYPIILLCLTIMVTVILFTFVLPRFFVMFENMQLPLLTRIVLGISKAFTNYWYLLLGAVCLIIALIPYLAKQPKLMIKIHKMLLKTPKFGPLLTIIYTSRFARTLSSLYSSGVSIIDAVIISAKIIGNDYMLTQFDDVVEKIKDGNLLSESMKSVTGIDKKLISAIYIGEETGKLDDMLISMANNYDYEAEAATTKMLTFLEPIMIIIMALIVGTIMAAVMLPMLSIYSSIG
ncbi:MAG: type II secretion system F family protein [Eubacteriales bacterium]|nr:type II secretion system F family protein [Eubacteriales bacterium]